MPDGTQPATTRFSAFISYNHADARAARRLHRRLESYRLPRRVSARHAADRSRRLEPVFLDRAEMGAAPELTQAVREAIAESRHLIVVCSPSAAASDWVAREIRLFRELRPDGRILAALAAGDPATAFPPELLSIDAQGRSEAPLAADMRPGGGDGGRLALLKLVAPLAGVRLDDLVQRDAQRRARRVIVSSVGIASGLVIAGILAFVAIQARLAESQEHARGGQAFDRMVGERRARLKHVGRLDLLDELNRDALALLKRGADAALPEEDRERKARALCGMIEDDTKKGDFVTAEAEAREALAITGALLKAHPKAAARVYDHAQSEYWLGFVRMREGDTAGAVPRMQAYADLAYRLVALEPQNPHWWTERGDANSDLATLVLRRTVDTARAGPLFAAAQQDYEAAARRLPEDDDLRVDVEDGYGWLADVRRLSGDYAGALVFRNRQRALIEAQLAADRHDAVARARLVSNDLALGRLATARGAWRQALSILRSARAAALDLSDQDPKDKDIAQQARAIQLFEARAMMSAPVAKRPAAREIQAALGDCDADARLARREELTAFCRLLTARFLEQSGKSNAVSDLRKAVDLAALVPGYRLSERWLIDLTAESVA